MEGLELLTARKVGPRRRAWDSGELYGRQDLDARQSVEEPFGEALQV